MPNKVALLISILIAFVPLAALGATSEPSTTKTPLEVRSIRIEPTAPGPDTLCKLFVELHNDGKAVATQLGFSVKLNGLPIDVYAQQLYMLPIGPGETQELRLFNFWTTESFRSEPEDGKLEIQVELLEAQWTEISMDGKVEVWSPIGPIDALPGPMAMTVDLRPTPTPPQSP